VNVFGRKFEKTTIFSNKVSKSRNLRTSLIQGVYCEFRRFSGAGIVKKQRKNGLFLHMLLCTKNRQFEGIYYIFLPEARIESMSKNGPEWRDSGVRAVVVFKNKGLSWKIGVFAR
jgi:hypothetical protein